ncbi:uncharacterized protein YALI1_B21946g [Yarrowia lipolytica]|uniref:Uncharacterized protein n=1 Tax=Yarrowia lipolytica TaxID=4952 RepID=A0A1D8N850_YARLL|nr:hypothetical protein YALI1_B21946g [Yarrowia lipolytica]
MSLETTMQSHTQFRCTELRLHNIGLEMSQLLNRAKTGNELLKVEYNNEERGGDEREANLPLWNVFYISTYMPPDREHSCTLVFKHNVIQQMSIM